MAAALYRDVEALTIAALNAGMSGFGETTTAHTRIPADRPAEFFHCFRTGGPAETPVTEAALITLEAWAATEARAVHLLNRGRAILRAQAGVLFGVTEYGGPTNLPDPTTSQVRYTASFVVRARAALTA